MRLAVKRKRRVPWWIKLSFAGVLMIIAAGVGLNYFMDPYFTFDHSYRFNQLIQAYNEREQKSSYLRFHPERYDLLLLGSSRVTYFDQNAFDGHKAFNFAASMMEPQEFDAYISYAKRCNHAPFGTIVMGLDFFGTGVKQQIFRDPEEIFARVSSPFYRIRKLLSFETFKVSLNSLIRSVLNKPLTRSYDRHNVAHTAYLDERWVLQSVNDMDTQELFGAKEEYRYDPHYKERLKEIIAHNPESRFIVFTTPVASDYLKKLFDRGLFPAYARWLRTLTELFGEVHHYMDFNHVSDAYPHFFMDQHHLYPIYTRWIVEDLLGSSHRSDDFGKVLDSKNLSRYLNYMRARWQSYTPLLKKSREQTHEPLFAPMRR